MDIIQIIGMIISLLALLYLFNKKEMPYPEQENKEVDAKKPMKQNKVKPPKILQPVSLKLPKLTESREKRRKRSRASRACQAVQRLANRRDMVIYQEIINKPKGL